MSEGIDRKQAEKQAMEYGLERIVGSLFQGVPSWTRGVINHKDLGYANGVSDVVCFITKNPDIIPQLMRLGKIDVSDPVQLEIARRFL
ncbi:MAG: hypothetical protein ACOCXT_03715 [Candidatus Dojkabacteria bacterium]